MPFIKKYNDDFKIVDNRIVLSNNYLKNNLWRFKKITGSRLATILNMNKYSTPVQEWMIMVNIYKKEMDRTLLEVGEIIEPKIKKFVEKKLNHTYLSYDPKKIGYDLFNDNQVFGGIPDGEPVSDNGEISYDKYPMLEIKTTSIDSFKYCLSKNDFILQKDENNLPIVKEEKGNLKKWFGNQLNYDLNELFKNQQIILPVEYGFQLSLYMYLRNINNGIFAISFLNYDAYRNPNDYIASDENTILYEMLLDLKEFKEYIDKATEWYQNYIKTGISPELTHEDFQFIKNELEIEIN